MTGWRIGYALCAAPIAKAMANYLSHSTGAPGTMCQCAAIEALSGPQDEDERMRQVFEQRRDLSSPHHAMPLRELPEAERRVLCHGESREDHQKADRRPDHPQRRRFLQSFLLEKSLVAVVPGIGFGAPNFMRLSYAISTENIVTGMDRLEAFEPASVKPIFETRGAPRVSFLMRG